MEYKTYTNEEVKYWWDALPFYSSGKELYDDWKEDKEKYPYGHGLPIAVVADYLDSIDSETQEHILLNGTVHNVECLTETPNLLVPYIDKEIEVQWVYQKARGDMKDKYDIYEAPRKDIFKNIKILKLNDADMRLKLSMSLGAPIFMQDCDNRLICKPEEMWPEKYKFI